MTVQDVKNFKDPLVGIFAFLIFVSSIFYTNKFIYPSLASYYFYLIATSSAILIVGFIFIFKGLNISLSPIVIIAFGWGVYIFLRSSGLNFRPDPFAIYLLINILFMTSIGLFFRSRPTAIGALWLPIALVGVFESIFTILQYVQILPSTNHFFRCSGTLENPNITAMFIVMCLPANFALIRNTSKNLKALSYFIFLLFSVALLMLECRTAILGALVGIIFILNYKYSLFNKFFRKGKTLSSYLFILIFGLIITTGGIYLLNKKKASTDGRKLIYKISYSMFLDRAILGFGYGEFEKNYNLYQSEYFKSGKGTGDEINTAAFVRYAYNEFIENAVEGGLVGCVLFTGLLLCTIVVGCRSIYVKKTTKKDGTSNKSRDLSIPTYFDDLVIGTAGAIVFTTMSICNFTLQAVPVMSLFMCYAATVAGSSRFNACNIEFHQQPVFQRTTSKFIAGGIISLTGAVVMIFTVDRTLQSMTNKDAVRNIKQGDIAEGFKQLRSLETDLGNCESYWHSYSNELYRFRQYQAAISAFVKLINLTSDPVVYTKLGDCYLKGYEFKKALTNYQIAKYIQPNKLGPRYKLMRLALICHDRELAVTNAQEILAMPLKVLSKEAQFYRTEALKLVNEMRAVSYHPSYQNSSLSSKNIKSVVNSL